MSGFSTSRSGQGIDNIVKQYGSILRGHGPPVPKAGVLGDLYIDVVTFQLFEKRCVGTLDDWGHYLFVVPSTYKNTLKWFGPSRPTNALGRPGDYYLQWGGYNNYGMQLMIWGPKLVFGWPENGQGASNDGNLVVANTVIRSIGLVDEGPDQTDMELDKLVAVGLVDEYVIPTSVTADPGDPITQLGISSTGQLVTSILNPLYTAEDEHAL